jgi:hypothetical protein
MALDWLVLGIAFIAISLRLIAEGIDKEIVAADEQLHHQDRRRSLDFHRHGVQAKVRTR